MTPKLSQNMIKMKTKIGAALVSKVKNAQPHQSLPELSVKNEAKNIYKSDNHSNLGQVGGTGTNRIV